jgi:hypothetical protein
MSVKIRRYQASESDFTQKGRVRTNVEVPGSVGITDLTTSKCIFDMHIDCYERDSATKIHIPTSFGNGQCVGGAQALIRNSQVTSKMHGLLNERRQQNILSANLDWFTASRAGEDTKCLTMSSSNASYGISRVSKLPDCPFVLMNRPTSNVVFNTPSQSRRAELQIPFKHIDNFASMQQFPNAAVGDLVYNIQLEDQLQSVFPARMPTRAAVPCANVAAVGSKLGGLDAPLTLQPSYLSGYCREPKVGDVCYVSFKNTTAQPVAVAINAVANNGTAVLFTTTVATDPAITIGTKIVVTFTLAAVVTKVVRTVTNQVTGANGTYTLNAGLTGTAADDCTAISFSPDDVSSFLNQSSISNVTRVGLQYVVQVETPFDTFTATEPCQNIFIHYFSPNEDSAISSGLGGGTDVIPVSQDVIVSANQIGSAAAPLFFLKNTAGGLRTVQGTTLTVDAYDSCPWYVGAPVQILYGVPQSGTVAPDTIVDVQTSIASIEHTDLGTKIVVKNPITVAAGVLVVNKLALCHRDTYYATENVSTTIKRINCDWVVDEIYLQLHQLTLLPSQMASVMKAMNNISIPFIDQYLVQRNMPTAAVHADIVQAYTNTIGLAVFTPQNLEFLSGADNCSSYRFAIDGKTQTNQNILVGRVTETGRSLHNVLLKQFFANIGKTLMRYDIPECLANKEYLGDKATHHMLPLIIPAKAGESVVQLQLFAESGEMVTKNIFYLWFVAKSLNISNGRVSIA